MKAPVSLLIQSYQSCPCLYPRLFLEQADKAVIKQRGYEVFAGQMSSLQCSIYFVFFYMTQIKLQGKSP